ncbi:unnamed protein product [Calicophoron daubneyi]|uniref:Eukaryotic translation initiation factor 4E binding protein 1 n=1 Tax=Calicophoron daubneyi TaxID=300641 RepID=A0AAV2T1E4_CALDB
MEVKSSAAISVRRVRVTDPSQIPSDIGTTPGGTLFSTTPGGTRVIYDRDFMLHCRNSPIAQTPPADLPPMPGFALSNNVEKVSPHLSSVKEETQSNHDNGQTKGDDTHFEMDV